MRAVSTALLAACACAPAGCTRTHYRRSADLETYGILAEKTDDPRWQVPPFDIQAPPQSRNFDPFSPDCPPLPPDDPAAHRYMHCADGRAGYLHWHDRGDAASIESPFWLDGLERDASGVLPLDSQRAVELGLLNSREYQTELENLYLSALGLTLERFQFDLQWFGGNSTFYDFLGDSDTLTTTSNLGFTRAFTTGGQLVAEFANTFLWEFSSPTTTTAVSTITVSLVQPLLRGAFREVRMEGLTQAERDVLYAARNYARFRKQFYFDVVSGDVGYLSLLFQLQSIRNLEANLESLELNLRTHEALAQAGVVSPLQVDQVFQSYQAGQLRLIRARNNFRNAQDAYKIRLGLPPEQEVELDDALLRPFELNSPEVNRAQRDVDTLLAEFRELDAAPSRERLSAGFERLSELHATILEQWENVSAEWEQWVEIDATARETAPEQERREDATRDRLRSRLDDLRRDLTDTERDLVEAVGEVSSAAPDDAWTTIQRLARDEGGHAADLFVIQSQIRAYLIQLDPIRFTADDEAIAVALANRLDLMNTRGRVVDNWRRIEVAADALEANFDIVTDAVVATAPGTANPVNFSSAASSLRVGFQFDAPLNRMGERNTYRAQLVEYQRARRQFIADRDSVVQAVRLDLRELEADRLNFEIARQSLIVAARQVELARDQLLAPNQEGDSSTTQDFLGALNSLLEAKNTLISVWISYETNRLRLLLDTEALQLDEQGLLRDGNLRPSESESDPPRPPGDAS